MTKKVFMQVIGNVFPEDSVRARRDNTFEIRAAYFYRAKRTPIEWGKRVMAKLPKGKFELVRTADECRRQPAVSYFVAVVRPL